MNKPGFDQLLALYRAFRFRPGTRACELLIATEEQAELLRSILREKHEFGVSLRATQGESFAVGDIVQLQADDPRVGLGLLADDFDDVLTFRTGRIKEHRFFLIEPRYACTDLDPPEIVRRYRQVLELISLLAESAAYLDKEDQELVFVADGKWSLPVLYVKQDLETIDPQGLRTLLERFGQNTHREQKLSILAKAVQSTCAGAAPKERFSKLLAELPALLRQVDDGYRLFAAEFSYERIRDQLEATRLEETGKIHRTLSEIQNQILGIPVATVVVATQLKASSGLDPAFWVNTAILAGVWVFVVLTGFVLRNQLHSLDVIADEIARKKERISAERFHEVHDIVTKIFPKLEERLCTQRKAFYWVGGVVVVGLLIAHVVYFMLTGLAQEVLMRGWDRAMSFI